MTEDLFEQARYHFNQCLMAREDELNCAQEKLRATLLAIEETKTADLNSSISKNAELFMQMFQFESLSADSIWKKVPKVFAMAGEYIQCGSESEDRFRDKVIQQNLGRFMKFTR